MENKRVLRKKARFYYNLLKKQLEKTPEDAASWWYLALSTAVLGRLKEGVEIVQKAIYLEPENKIPRIFLARFYMALGNYKKAIEVLEESLMIESQRFWDPTIYNLLGMLNLLLGNNQRAIDLLNMALEQEKDFAHIWVNLGIAYEGLEKWKEALECYLKAAELNPMLLELKISRNLNHLYAFQEDVSSLYQGLSWHINYCSRKLGSVF